MSKLLVILPGGFHPYHAGHFELYQSAKKAFPGADLYVAATNDQSERPFPFALKEKLAKLAGVEPGHFIQVKSPFQAKEITQNYDPEQDVLVFVRSEKDRNEPPKPGGTKKDGSPAYFQPWTGEDLQPFSKHAYIEYLPTVEFGPGITSATQIRNAWPTLNDKRKLAMVMSLYPATQKNPKLAQTVVGMFDQVIGGQVSEDKSKAIAQTVRDLKNPPEIMKLRAIRDKEREETYKNAQFGKDDLEDDGDIELQQLMRKAQQRYPNMPSKQQAFIKFIQRALKHSEEEDTQHDKEIADLKQDVNKLKKDHDQIMKVSESLDYLDEK